MEQILIVGLDRKSRQEVASVAEHAGFTARTVGTPAEARELVERVAFSVVLIDSGVDNAMGLEAVAMLPIDPDQTVVFLSEGQEGPLVDALAGLDSAMFEVLPRHPEPAALTRVLKSVKRHGGGTGKEPTKGFEQMLGNSPEMLEVYNMIAKVAPTDAAVLICGDSGTGKELVARAIHDRSERRDGPFVAVNCGAIAENLIESELFGHEKGAFTGAEKRHAGVFQQADGGTLFLDEVTEMPLEMQVRFLRVLETGQLRRLGAEKELKVDVRVVAATNREPRERVEEGAFREDLMYRLAVFPITLPPLTARGEDVCLLGAHFLSLHNKENKTEKRLTDVALRRLKAYSWPGNVRQLRNIVQRAYIMEGAQVNLDCLTDLLENADAGTCDEAVNADAEESADAGAQRGGIDPTLKDDSAVTVEVGTSIEEAEKQLILKTLDELGGNKTEAAKVLGISLKTLYNRLNAYNI